MNNLAVTQTWQTVVKFHLC